MATLTGSDLKRKLKERQQENNAVKHSTENSNNDISKVTGDSLRKKVRETYNKVPYQNAIDNERRAAYTEGLVRPEAIVGRRDRLFSSIPDEEKELIETYIKKTEEKNLQDYNNRANGTFYLFNNYNPASMAAEEAETAMKTLINDYGYTADDVGYYAANWENIQGLEKKAAYEKKREEAVADISEEEKELLTEYNEQRKVVTTNSLSPDTYASAESAREKSNAIATELSKTYGYDVEKLERMAQYVKELNDIENTEKMQEAVKEDIQEHPAIAGALHTLGDIGTSPLAGPLATLESLASLGYADKDAPINTNSDLYFLSNYAQAVEGAVNEEIGEEHPVGQFAYNTGVGIGKTAMSMAIGGGVTKGLGLTGKTAQVVGELVTLPQFGTSAYATTLQKDQEKGITKENAIAHATAAGAAEMAFEKISLDHAYSILRKSGKTALANKIADIFVQANIEGSEEVATSLADAFADSVINGRFSDYEMSVAAYMDKGKSEEEARKSATIDFCVQLGQEYVAGTISGGVLGGGTTAIQTYNSSNMGKAVNQNEQAKAAVIKQAKSMDKGTTARDIVDKKGAENISNREMGQILESIQDSGRNVEDIISPFFQENQELSNDQETAEESEILEEQEAAGESVSIEQHEEEYISKESGDEESSIKETGDKGQKRKQGVGNAVTVDTDTPVMVLELQSVGKNDAEVKLTDGTTMPLSNLRMEERELQQLYNVAAVMDTPEAGNAIINNYAGENTATYAEACMVFYNAGQLGRTSFEELLANKKNSRIVAGVNNISTLKEMYELGVNARERNKGAQNNQSNSEIAPVQLKEGRVIDDRTDKTDNRILSIAQAYVQKTGLEVTLNDSLSMGENGHFSKALSRIALSSTSSNEYATLIHETNEFAESYNPEGMAKVVDKVLSYAESQEGIEFLAKTVKAYQTKYQEVEPDKTYESAAEEMVYDYIAGIFSSKEGIESFCDFLNTKQTPMQEQKGIIETVVEFFKNLANKISSYIEDHTLSKISEKGLKLKEAKARELQNMIIETWNEAVTRFETDTKKSSEKTQSQGLENSTKKYSIQIEDQKLGDRLNNSEWNRFLKLIGDYHRGEQFQKSQENDIIIPVDNKLIYTDGNYENPGIRKIIEFHSKFEDEIDEARRQIYDFEKRKSSIEEAYNTIEGYLGQGFVSGYAFDGGSKTKGFDRPSERRKSLSDTYHTKREQNRRRVYIKDGKIVDDLKLSIDVDLMSILDEDYSKDEIERASIIQEGFEALKSVTVNDTLVRKVAYQIKKDYKSSYDLDTLTKNLTRVFAYMKEHGSNLQYEDMVRVVQEVATPVIEQSTEKDAWEQNMYQSFRKYFKGKTIRLSEEQRKEVAFYYGSFENFRKMNFGNIVFASKQGTYLDNLWSEIVEQSGYILEQETVSADQPMALVDAMSALKPIKRNIYGMDQKQAAYDVALDIFHKFFAVQAEESANRKVYEKTNRLKERQVEYRKKVKKEYDKSLARLREVEEKKREEQARYYETELAIAKFNEKSALEDNNRKAVEKYKKREQELYNRIRKANQKADERVLKLKAAHKQDLTNRRELQERRKMQDRVKRTAKSLVAMFNTNTDKKHIPEGLKDTVARFVTSIDFAYADETTKAALEWRSSLEALYGRLNSREAAVQDGYEELYNLLHELDNEDLGAGGKPSELLRDISAFISNVSDLKITDLSSEQLKTLADLMEGLKKVVSKLDQLYVNKRNESLSVIAEGSLNDMGAQKDKKAYTKLGEMGVNLLDASMLDARSFFYRLGDNALSIYNELRTGFNDKVWHLKEAQDYMAEKMKGLKVKTWTGPNAEIHEFIFGGKTLRMTTAQIMSLYELKKRYAAKLHINMGGVQPTDIKKGTKTIKQIKGVPLSDYDVDRICDKLTAEQKKLADDMQWFLENTCSSWGNETTMLLYGYKRFGAKNYFPIRVDGDTVDIKDTPNLWGVRSMGFTKQVQKNANNAIVIDDIFDVFVNHVTQMAGYSAMSAPLMDAMKWYNYKSKVQSGDILVINNTIQKEIKRTHGKEYQEYFRKLIKDINGEVTNGFESKISDILVGNSKAASVGANLRVVIQQPTALFRAAAVLDPKYLLQPHKSAMKKSKEDSAIALWKSWGYFETSLGQSMRTVIVDQMTKKEWVVDKAMWLAQKADDVTWGYLWRACELEIMDTHKDIQPGTEEFKQLVSERFDDVIDQTQVVDTVLHRSHIMRSQNGAIKMATAFMAEPTKSYNLLVNRARDIYEKKEGAVGNFARASIAFVVTGIINAALVSLIDTWRYKEDDDEAWQERWLAYWGENTLDSILPINMIPYLKDILSIISGYEVDRMDVKAVADIIESAQSLYTQLMKGDTDEEKVWKKSKKVIKGISGLTGVPVSNLIRTVESFKNFIDEMILGN